MGDQCHMVLCFNGHKVYEQHCYCVDCREAVSNGEPELWIEEMKRMRAGGKVYPVGYSAGGSSAYIDGLMDQANMLLIDTRIAPDSWQIEWKKATLSAKYGVRYKVAGKVLGNKNYKGGPIDIVDLATGIHGLEMYLNEGHDIILLCTCTTYSTCHRKVIVEVLQEKRPSVQIVQPLKPEPIAVLAQPTLFEVPEERRWHDI